MPRQCVKGSLTYKEAVSFITSFPKAVKDWEKLTEVVKCDPATAKLNILVYSKVILDLELIITTLPDDDCISLVDALNGNKFLRGEHFTPSYLLPEYKRNITLSFPMLKESKLERVENLSRIKTDCLNITLDFRAGIMLHIKHKQELDRALPGCKILYSFSEVEFKRAYELAKSPVAGASSASIGVAEASPLSVGPFASYQNPMPVHSSSISPTAADTLARTKVVEASSSCCCCPWW